MKPTDSRHSLPSLLTRWLEAVLPRDRADVIGDLEELHQRQAQRWGRLFAFAVSALTTLWITLAFGLIWLRERNVQLRWVSKLEVLLAVRLLRKQPFLSATAVISLAAGIAVAAIGFTMIDEMLHGQLPVPNGDRYVRFDVRDDRGERAGLTAEHLRLFRQESQTLEHVGAIASGRRNLRHPGGAIETAVTAEITPVSLSLQEATPLLGRQLIEDDATVDAAPTVVIRESLWRRSYGADPGVLGQRLSVAGGEAEIVGVLPDDVGFPSGGEVWTPLVIAPAGSDSSQALSLFGVLRPGASLAQAGVELTSLATVIEPSELRNDGSAARLSIEAVSFTALPGPLGVMSIVGIVVPMLVVLVIALNVANLIHARTASRARELGVRTALGAPRARLIGQLSLEAGVMGSVAAVLGGAVAIVTLRQIDALITEAPFWVDLTAGPRTLVYVGVLAVLIAVTCGALPAMRATRRDLGGAIAEGGNAFDVSRFGAAMMVTQMALAVALLSGALVMGRSLWSAAGSDLDLPDQQVLTAQVVTPAAYRSDIPAPKAVAAAVQQIPGVLAAGTADHLPRYDAPAFAIEIESAGSTDQPQAVATRALVSPGFLGSLEAPLVAGRPFDEADANPEAPPVAIVNEPFVQRFFSGSTAVGARFRTIESADRRAVESEQAVGDWREIVGVVPDLGLGGGVEEFAAGFYVPGFTDRRYFYASMLSSGNAESLGPSLRSAMIELDPELVLTRVQPLGLVNSEERSFQAGFGATLCAVGALALLLSLVGLYAMISLTITQRTREIGVRLALGASRFDVLRSVLRRAGLNLLLGAGLGLGFGWMFIRLQDQQLAARLPASEPWILPVVLVAFAVAGMAACLVPAVRAHRIAPTEALRAD